MRVIRKVLSRTLLRKQLSRNDRAQLKMNKPCFSPGRRSVIEAYPWILKQHPFVEFGLISYLLLS